MKVNFNKISDIVHAIISGPFSIYETLSREKEDYRNYIRTLKLILHKDIDVKQYNMYSVDANFSIAVHTIESKSNDDPVIKISQFHDFISDFHYIDVTYNKSKLIHAIDIMIVYKAIVKEVLNYYNIHISNRDRVLSVLPVS